MFQIGEKRNSQLLEWFSFTEQIHADSPICVGTVLCEIIKQGHSFLPSTYHFGGRRKYQANHQQELLERHEQPNTTFLKHQASTINPFVLKKKQWDMFIRKQKTTRQRDTNTQPRSEVNSGTQAHGTFYSLLCTLRYGWNF